jgi:bifunctional non-homologous end joining protein LigD
MKTGHLHFVLHGKKLQGEWTLVQMHGKFGADGKNWLLMKVRDKFASTSRDVLKQDQSVKTDRSMEEIAEQRDKIWKSNRPAKAGKSPVAATPASPHGRVAPDGDAAITATGKTSMPASLSPQLAVLSETAPSGEQWLHEIKYDGYRIMAHIRAGKVRLITRNGKDWTTKFPTIARRLESLKVDSAIVDGELVVLDDQGRSDFQALQTMLKHPGSAEPSFFAFDLPYCDGFDLRNTPLLKRKTQLEDLLKRSKLSPHINFSEHIQGEGSAVIDKACGMSLEGIVSKRVDSPYVSRRDPSWLKSKCGQRQEFVVIGYTDPQGSRTGFGSLLLGYHDNKKHLVYAGRVGTGFNQKLLKQTLAELKRLGQKEPPTHEPPPARERQQAHWVKPQRVAEVTFTGWTRDGMLRHPAFVAFRTDKPASQIVREKAIAPQAANRGKKKGPA